MNQEEFVKHFNDDDYIYTVHRMISDYNDMGLFVSGIDFIYCDNIQLLIQLAEQLKEQTMYIHHWEATGPNGKIEGSSKNFIYVNPIVSNFNIPPTQQTTEFGIPNLFLLNDWKVILKDDPDYERLQNNNPESNSGKIVVVVENFNLLDMETQQLFRKIADQNGVKIIAQVNYSLDNWDKAFIGIKGKDRYPMMLVEEGNKYANE